MQMYGSIREPVETIHIQSLIEGGSRLEHMNLLRCGQEGIKVCTESMVADVAEVVLRPCDVLTSAMHHPKTLIEVGQELLHQTIVN